MAGLRMSKRPFGGYFPRCRVRNSCSTQSIPAIFCLARQKKSPAAGQRRGNAYCIEKTTGWASGFLYTKNAVYECSHTPRLSNLTKCERNSKKRHTPLVKTGKWHYNRHCGAAKAAVYEWCEHSYVGRGVLVTPRGCRIYYFHFLLYIARLKNARGKRKKAGKSIAAGNMAHQAVKG